jgi:His/Glu/Gln/Arg/opine family amino acid ABC transporter permease subunit
MNPIISYIVQNAWLLWQGAAMTLQLWGVSTCLSLSIGILFGILNSKRLWVAGISPTVATITFVLRAIPFYVQLLIVYFVMPAVFGISLSAFIAGVIALGFCSGSYVSNIVRAGINSIAAGQWEACYVLGFSKLHTLRFVILPQMLRTMLPALMNELESILKSTSIISSIGVLELTRMGMNIVSREMNPIPIYCSIAVVYLFFSCVLFCLAKLVESRFGDKK